MQILFFRVAIAEEGATEEAMEGSAMEETYQTTKSKNQRSYSVLLSKMTQPIVSVDIYAIWQLAN